MGERQDLMFKFIILAVVSYPIFYNSENTVITVVFSFDWICLGSGGGGAKNNPYKIITAALKEIAAITFFVSMFIYSSFWLDQNLLRLLKI